MPAGFVVRLALLQTVIRFEMSLQTAPCLVPSPAPDFAALVCTCQRVSAPSRKGFVAFSAIVCDAVSGLGSIACCTGYMGAGATARLLFAAASAAG